MSSFAIDHRRIEDSSQSLVNLYLARAIEEFGTNRLSNRLIRRLSEEFPSLFLTAARSHLGSPRQSMALRYLTTLVLRQESMFEFLTCPKTTSRENAVNLFKRFMEVDPSIDVKLAEHLPNRRESNLSEALDGPHSTRALDILDQTSRGPRLLPIIGHLASSRDSYISAKATLFVGRRVQNPAWARQQLGHRDQRIRANALESLWGLNSPPAICLMEQCANDANNRVWGNAMFGLHLLGRDAERRVLDYSSSDNYQFRSTAAWVMGRIASNDCLLRLTLLVKDDDPRVRSTALRSLLGTRRSETGRPPEIAVPAPPAVQAIHPEPPPKTIFDPFIEIRLDGSAFNVR